MNISELFDLTKWIDKNVVSTDIVSKYQALTSLLQQHAQANNQKPPFEAQKEELIEAIEEINLTSLTKDQIAFLTCMGIANNIGKTGTNLIEEILYKNNLDPATAHEKFNEIVHNLNSGIKKSNSLKEGLTDCVMEEEYETDDEALIRICFTRDASFSNVIDFKDWGKVWFEIGRGIAMAHDTAPEEIKIVGATKGSIILELAVAYGIASTISKIIISALNVAEKVIDLRTKAEQFRGMKLTNDKLAKEIEKEADTQKNLGIQTISEQITKELKIDKKGDGEKAKVLNDAIKNLVNFIEKGGEVDLVLPDEETEDDETEEKQEIIDLKTAFQEIRRLENKLELIEHKEP